eukprot:2613405-Rhodomonas_salina.1
MTLRQTSLNTRCCRRVLRVCYAVSGTDVVYAATSGQSGASRASVGAVPSGQVSAYACVTPCPRLLAAMLLT